MKSHQWLRGAGRVALGALALTLAACGGGGGGVPTTSTAASGTGFDFGGNDPYRVVAFGDSITLGTIDEGVKAARPYPTQLQAMIRGLDARYRVVNRGVGGEDTREGLRRFGTVIAKDRAGYVLVMEGTNDATLHESPAVIVGNLRTMIEQARASSTIPVLATIPPNFRSSPEPRRVIEETNPLIRALARELGVVLAEIHDGMNDPALFFSRDPLHPNQRGYDVMAGIWFGAMQEAIRPAASTTVARALGLRLPPA